MISPQFPHTRHDREEASGRGSTRNGFGNNYEASTNGGSTRNNLGRNNYREEASGGGSARNGFRNNYEASTNGGSTRNSLGRNNYRRRSDTSRAESVGSNASNGLRGRGGRPNFRRGSRNMTSIRNSFRRQPSSRDSYNNNSYDDYDDVEYGENGDDDFSDEESTSTPYGESSSAFLANGISSNMSLLNGGDTIHSNNQHLQQHQQTPASKLLDIIEDAMPRLDSNNNVIEGGAGEESKNNRKNNNNNLKETWRLINRWLWEHSVDEIADAMAIRGKDDATPLHYICQLPNPPAEIIEKFVTASYQSLTWVDNHGWLPLHHACAHNASGEVLKILIDANNLGTTKQDSHQRTPLHFYLIQCNNNSDSNNNNNKKSTFDAKSASNAKAIAENVRNLSKMGAPKYADIYGMLPMHYACAYGVSPLVLAVLRDAYPESIWARELKGRTPMHLAMANAHRDASPGVTKFLIENSNRSGEGGGAGNESNINASPSIHDDDRLVNIRDREGYLPLHLMPLGLRHFARADQMEEYPNQRNNVSECLKMYLAAKPTAHADFLTALQDLPEWLQDVAVVTTHVRNILNQKIVGIFPTFMLFFEFVMYIVIILVFDRTSNSAIEAMFSSCNKDIDESEAIEKLRSDSRLVYILWFGATYFLLRELIQIVSLWSLGSISRWFKDPYNWLDVIVIVLVYYFSLMMTVSPSSFMVACETWNTKFFEITHETFRSFAAFTKFTLLMAVVSFLRATLVDFAIVVGGVVYVTKRLGAFFLAVIVILITFSQIFYFLYYETQDCKCYRDATEAVRMFDNMTAINATHPTLEELEPLLYYLGSKCQSMFESKEAVDHILSDAGEWSLNDLPEINEDMYAHCEFTRSFLKVITMMMGEIGDEGRYDDNLVAQITYVAYAIIVVILLSNILIAIVTESYEVIQNDRAASVFLGNRLGFVAEMDAISYGVIRRLPKMLGGGDEGGLGGGMNDYNHNHSIRAIHGHKNKGSFYHGWKKIMELFDENFYDIQTSPTKIEFWCYLLFQILAIVVIIPTWLVLGLVTFGILWPPQIRELILVENKANMVSRSDIERQKLHQLKTIEKNLLQIQMDLTSEIMIDREEIKRVKNQVQTTQDAVKTDLEQIRELMQTLLELGGSSNSSSR